MRRGHSGKSAPELGMRLGNGLGGMEGEVKKICVSIPAFLVRVACGFPGGACLSWRLGQSNDGGKEFGGEDKCHPLEGLGEGRLQQVFCCPAGEETEGGGRVFNLEERRER